MESLIHWLTSESAALGVYAAVVIAIVAAIFSPRNVRRRLRTAVIFGGLFGVFSVILPHLWKPTEHEDLDAITAAFGALAVVRVVFVLIVDIAIERGGKVPMNALVRDVLQACAYILVVLVALRAANMKPSSIIATGTVATAVIGLSLQETLGNLAAGVAIQLDRPVDVGDWIRLDKGDFLGRVVAMNWRAVTIETDERSYFVIPNGVFSKTPFMNHSRPGGATRRSLNFVVPYDIPPARVHDAIVAACTDCPFVLQTPPPSVFTWTHTDRGITYWLRFWISDFARRDAAQADVSTRVWYQLHRRKIPLAVPVHHQYMHAMDATSRMERDAEVLRDRRAAIDGVDFLRPLSDAAKGLLAQRGHRKLFSAGEVILRQGEAGRTFYIVRRGMVAVTMNGSEITRLGPGEFFGELALLTGRERHANVTATQETEVFEIDELMFRDVLKEDPKLAEKVAEIVGKRAAENEALKTSDGRPSVHDVRGFSEEILGRVRSIFALD